MATIQEARAQLEQQKNLLSEKQQEVSTAKQKLLEAQRQIPATTQQRLRQGIYSGLQGRNRRQVVQRAKNEINKNLDVVKGYETQLGDYNTQLQEAESQIANAEAEQNAFDVAKKLFSKNIPSSSTSGRVRYYLREFEQEEGAAREAFANSIADFEASNPTEKLSVDWKNMRVTGVSSGALAQSLPVDEYNKKVAEFNQDLSSLPDLQSLKDSSKNLDINQKTDLANIQTQSIAPNLIPGIQEPVLTVSAVPEPQGILEKGQAFLSQKRAEYQTQQARGEKSDLGTAFLGGFGAGAGLSFLGTAQALTHPIQTIKNLPSGLASAYKYTTSGELANTIYREPQFVTGFVGAEILTGKGLGKLSDVAVTKTTAGLTKLSPKFRPVITETNQPFIKNVPSVNDNVFIRPGYNLKALSGEDTTFFKGTSPGSFDLPLSPQVSKITESLPTQTRLAGQNIRAVSAQRGLFNVLEREKLVNKPLPTPESPPLERAFFADPYGRLRVSRLGVLDEPKQAGMIDILSGDVTFKGIKPQALVFENAQVEKFPSYLKDVEKKLLTGQTLTAAERQRLLDFQLSPSGSFKPVGFLSGEPEVTLAPGEIIVKEKSPAVTLINGKRVPIYRVSVKKATPETAKLLERAKKGELTETELKKLTSQLKKESGFDYSYDIVSKKYLSPARISGGIASPFFRNYSKPTKTQLRNNAESPLVKFSPSPELKEDVNPSPFFDIPKRETKPITKKDYGLTPGSPPRLIPPTKKPPIFAPFNRNRGREEGLKKGKKKEDILFIPEIKVKKKWLPLGKYTNLEQSVKVGKTRLLKDLRASLRVQKVQVLPTGNPKQKKVLRRLGLQRIANLEDALFRKSKQAQLSPTVLVQRQKGRLNRGGRGGRLATFGERREILDSRRRLGKLKRNMFFK